MTTAVKSLTVSWDHSLQHSSSTRRTRVSRFFVAVAGFAAVNFMVVSALGATSTKLTREAIAQQNELTPLYGSWTWWMAKGFLDQRVAPDVVLLGSSQMNAVARNADAKFTNKTVDCVLHREVFSFENALTKAGFAHKSVSNCALDGAMASDYWMAAKALLTGDLKPKVVVLGISPRDFIDNKLVSASSTEPYRFFSRYVDAGKLSSIAYPDPIARTAAQFEWTFNLLPTRALHGSIESWLGERQQIDKEQKHQVIGVVQDSQMMVHPGQFMMPAKTEGFWVDNSHEYTGRYKNSAPPCYPIQISFFKEFLGLMRDENIKVLVVGMPTLPQNRNLLSADFWQSYRKQIATICSNAGATWVDMSDDASFDPSCFVDTVHVNGKGGEKMLAAFTQKLGADNQFAKVLSASPSAGLAYTSKAKLPE